MLAKSHTEKRKTTVKYFAIHLREKRLAKGWDQETVAHMAGLSVRTIQRIEAGSSCSLETLKSLSAAMDLKHFSELLPTPDKSEYKPTIWDFMGVLFKETLWRGIYRTMVISMVCIGALTSMYVAEEATREEMTYEERLESELTRNELAKGGDHSLLKYRSREEVEEYVNNMVETEKRPLNKEEWNMLLTSINWTFFVSMIIAFLFGIYRTTTSFEFDSVVIKPAREKFGI